MTADIVDNGHSEVGPSSIESVILCPGRVRMQRGCEDVKSFAAAEGTRAHEIAETYLLKNEYPPAQLVGYVSDIDGHEIEVTDEMVDAVTVYIDHINDLRAIAGEADEYVEVKGSLGWLGLPEVYGTADYVRDYPFNTLFIRDYKHGQGVLVDSVNNPQLMVYALIAGGKAFRTYDAINVGIVQPRGKYGDQVKIWETTPEVILEWADTVLKPAIDLAMQDNAPLYPGEKQCQWCRAKDVCPALATKALQTAQEDFKDFADIQPVSMVETLTIEKIAQVYQKLPLLKSFIKAVEARVFYDLSAGLPVPGYKLAAGKKSRDWFDEKSAEAFLTEKGIVPFEKKLLSPAKAEKALGKQKKEVQKLIRVSEGNPVIVPDTDERPAISTAAIDFKDV